MLSLDVPDLAPAPRRRPPRLASDLAPADGHPADRARLVFAEDANSFRAGS